MRHPSALEAFSDPYQPPEADPPGVFAYFTKMRLWIFSADKAQFFNKIGAKNENNGSQIFAGMI
jgi:hypothetical protein